jgi:hypothetical protein
MGNVNSTSLQTHNKGYTKTEQHEQQLQIYLNKKAEKIATQKGHNYLLGKSRLGPRLTT